MYTETPHKLQLNIANFRKSPYYFHIWAGASHWARVWNKAEPVAAAYAGSVIDDYGLSSDVHADDKFNFKVARH